MATTEKAALPAAPEPSGAKPAEGIRHFAWQFCGAMFMEQKNGCQAVSFHRVLAAILFLASLYVWLFLSTEVPDKMIYTLWGLLGINGGQKIAKSMVTGGQKPPVTAGYLDVGPAHPPEQREGPR